jgi:hypothetical protein
MNLTRALVTDDRAGATRPSVTNQGKHPDLGQMLG